MQYAIQNSQLVLIAETPAEAESIGMATKVIGTREQIQASIDNTTDELNKWISLLDKFDSLV
uniref:Uncharacterized protein n=1 Tax=viral metagenome TaxID=1070528 RepID=A0A6M3KPW2_9ZZZZ